MTTELSQLVEAAEQAIDSGSSADLAEALHELERERDAILSSLIETEQALRELRDQDTV